MIVVWVHIMRIRWIPFWRTTSRASFWNGPTRFQNSLVDLCWVCHPDGGGAWQGFCWGAEQREQPRSNDWDQVLGRKGEETQVGKLVWFLFLHFFIVVFAVHQPRVPLWADEGWHDKKDGVNSQCHWQCILSLFQVVRKHCMLFFTWSVTLRE